MGQLLSKTQLEEVNLTTGLDDGKPRRRGGPVLSIGNPAGVPGAEGVPP
jgi:hypothetical protein